ncbi:MAG: phosphodiester glycosidase family protein [Geminicoccaceae bacterium]
MSRQRHLPVVNAAVAALLALAVWPAWAEPELPLGRRGLSEERSLTELAPGVTHLRVVRGGTGLGDGFVLETAPLREQADAKEILGRLTAAGFNARLDRAAENADLGTPILFARADFATSVDAEARQNAFESAAGSVALRALSDIGEPDVDGSWIVNVLAIDLSAYPGRVDVQLAGGVVPGGATVLDIAGQAEGVDAAVNASFFVFRDEWGGTTGRPAGLFIEDGRLASEGIDGRPALALGDQSAGILTDVRTTIALDIAGESLIADGVNRKPGRIVNCGNPGDVQGEASAHDFFCDDPDEIIIFDTLFGDTSDAGEGVELVVTDGSIAEIRQQRGGPIPAEGFTVQATGAAADRLGFHYGWVLRRHPRTAAGISEDGRTLYLVTVDGRQPGVSVGATITELGLLMRTIGAHDAVNLDGGGSTTLVVGDALANTSSDPEPRAVSDAILLVRDE